MIREKHFLFCLCFCHLVGVFGDELKSVSVSVMEGESVTLQSGVTELQGADLMKWTFGTNGSLIAKISKENSVITDALDGKFRDRLKLDHQTRSLTITNTRTTDSGLYEVTISRSSSSPKLRFNVTVTGSPGPKTALISAAAAAGFLLLVAAVVIFFIYRKHRKTDQQVEAREEEVTYADTTFYTKKAPSVKQEEDVVYAGIVTKR